MTLPDLSAKNWMPQGRPEFSKSGQVESTHETMGTEAAASMKPLQEMVESSHEVMEIDAAASIKPLQDKVVSPPKELGDEAEIIDAHVHGKRLKTKSASLKSPHTTDGRKKKKADELLSKPPTKGDLLEFKSFIAKAIKTDRPVQCYLEQHKEHEEYVKTWWSDLITPVEWSMVDSVLFPCGKHENNHTNCFPIMEHFLQWSRAWSLLLAIIHGRRDWIYILGLGAIQSELFLEMTASIDSLPRMDGDTFFMTTNANIFANGFEEEKTDVTLIGPNMQPVVCTLKVDCIGDGFLKRMWHYFVDSNGLRVGDKLVMRPVGNNTFMAGVYRHLRRFGYSPYQDNCGDYYEPHGDQDDYDKQGPMYDDQLDPLIEEILWTEERILNLDLALVMECSLFEPPNCRDYSLTREEQIEANRDAIQARERFLKTVKEEHQLLQTQKDNEQREYWEHMQKMLEDFKKAMEQQEELEEIVVLEEDEESETESEIESNNVSILEYQPTSSPLYIENKITLAEMIARGTVVMLPESPKSQIVQKVKPTEGPVSEPPSPVAPETLEESVLLTCVEDTSPEKPVLEKFEPTTNPFDCEDSREGHVVIIEPATESQPIEYLESHVLAIKANDVDTPRTLSPPPIQDEYPPFFLLPPRHRNESKILDFDYKRTGQRWHQKRVKKVEFGIRNAGEPF
ncbi:unnamed protein product [Cuscuta campestris]|uniref:Uncharacterized protein n=1 Tax=Cuscuta campestris TaxID=132261 RepID=A0A484MXC2_9ASTE|nr:unnamed protein product [Cuscuta campestris]